MTQIAILLAAAPVGIDAMASHLFPRHRWIITGLGAALIVGVVCGSLRLIPGETVGDALTVLAPVGAVYLWIAVAHRGRRQMAERLATAENTLRSHNGRFSENFSQHTALQAKFNEIDSWGETLRELQGRIAAKLNVSDAPEMISKMVMIFAGTIREEIATKNAEMAVAFDRHPQELAAIKADVNQRFVDAFREIRELRTEIKGPLQVVDPQGRQRRIIAKHENIAELSEATETTNARIGELDKAVGMLQSWAENIIYGRRIPDEMISEPIGADYAMARTKGRIPVTIIFPKWEIWAHARLRPLEASLLTLGVDPSTFRPQGDAVELKDLEPLTPENQDKVKARLMRLKAKFGDSEALFADVVDWAVAEALPVCPDAKLVARIVRARS